MVDRTSHKPAPLPRTVFPEGPLEGEDFRNMWFEDLNARKRELVGCDLSYCVFERAYFRETKFTKCKFVGARFYDCNFRGVELDRCEFDYAIFDKTLIDPADIVPNLPSAPNMRRNLLQILRANANTIGDYDALRTYVLEEMDAAVDHQSRILRSKESYYKNKYKGFWPKFKAFSKLSGLRMDGFLWGHGERPFQIFISTAVIIFFLAALNMMVVGPWVGWRDSSYGLRSLEYVVRLFLDLEPEVRFRGWAAVDYFVAIYRYIVFGLAASVMFKIISHR